MRANPVVCETPKEQSLSLHTEYARQFGIERSLGTKEDVLKALAQRIIDRKGAFERAQV